MLWWRSEVYSAEVIEHAEAKPCLGGAFAVSGELQQALDGLTVRNPSRDGEEEINYAICYLAVCADLDGVTPTADPWPDTAGLTVEYGTGDRPWSRERLDALDPEERRELYEAATRGPCTAPAVTLRCVDGDTCIALCAEHAAELDAEANDLIAEVGGVYYCASLADWHLYVSPVRGQPAPWRPVGETTSDGGVALAEAIAPDAQAVLDPAALAGVAAKAAEAMRAAGLVYEDGAWGPPDMCQCGTVREDGQRCDVPIGADRVTVAYVPGYQRAQAHAGGARECVEEQAECASACAAQLVAEQPRWVRICDEQ